jgi:hypothetical protein
MNSCVTDWKHRYVCSFALYFVRLIHLFLLLINRRQVVILYQTPLYDPMVNRSDKQSSLGDIQCARRCDRGGGQSKSLSCISKTIGRDLMI